MLLKCPVIREGGSTYEVGGTDYHFKPQADGEHVAEVTNPAHQDRFLEIGFRLYRADEKKAAAPANPAPPKKSQPLVWAPSTEHPAEIDLGEGRMVKIADVIGRIAEAQGLDAAMWNGLEAERRHKLIDDMLDTMAAEAPAGEGATGGLAGEKDDGLGEDPEANRDALVAEYKEKFGKKPHHRWSAAKIREELAK